MKNYILIGWKSTKYTLIPAKAETTRQTAAFNLKNKLSVFVVEINRFGHGPIWKWLGVCHQYDER